MVTTLTRPQAPWPAGPSPAALPNASDTFLPPTCGNDLSQVLASWASSNHRGLQPRADGPEQTGPWAAGDVQGAGKRAVPLVSKHLQEGRRRETEAPEGGEMCRAKGLELGHCMIETRSEQLCNCVSPSDLIKIFKI